MYNQLNPSLLKIMKSQLDVDWNKIDELIELIY